MIDVMIAKILFIYKQRFGAEQTYEEAVRYYKMSANDGNSDALDSLKALLDKIQYSEYGKESNMNVIYLGTTLQNTEKEKTSAAINAAPELEPIAIDIPKEGNCGMNTHWVLDDSGVLTISGTGKIEPIRGRAELKHDPWRYIKKIVIERGVTEIGNQVFQRCRNLQDVTLPEGLLLIGKRAFACCYDIKSINIPNTVKAIEDGAFFQCKGLTHVTFPKSLELIGSEAFMNCHGLTSVSVPEEISIPKGRNIFFGCRNINLLERFDPMDDAQKSMVSLMDDLDQMTSEYLGGVAYSNYCFNFEEAQTPEDGDIENWINNPEDLIVQRIDSLVSSNGFDPKRYNSDVPIHMKNRIMQTLYGFEGSFYAISQKGFAKFHIDYYEQFLVVHEPLCLVSLKDKSVHWYWLLLRGGVIEILEWGMERSKYGENKPKEVYKEIQERNRRGGNIRI